MKNQGAKKSLEKSKNVLEEKSKNVQAKNLQKKIAGRIPETTRSRKVIIFTGLMNIPTNYSQHFETTEAT